MLKSSSGSIGSGGVMGGDRMDCGGSVLMLIPTVEVLRSGLEPA